MTQRDKHKTYKSLVKGKKLQPAKAGNTIKKSFFSIWAITFYQMVHCDNFFADSVRAHVFQQLLCITYALTPHGSKVMVHGVWSPQYQGFGKKSS
jgi:hypothetical protein